MYTCLVVYLSTFILACMSAFLLFYLSTCLLYTFCFVCCIIFYLSTRILVNLYTCLLVYLPASLLAYFLHFWKSTCLLLNCLLSISWTNLRELILWTLSLRYLNLAPCKFNQPLGDRKALVSALALGSHFQLLVAGKKSTDLLRANYI